jgi:DNA-binding NarL/FixJ family response regulator
MRVVGAAEDGRRAVNLAKVLKPDVVLMDVAMPLMNGAMATKAILHQSPNTRILAVSSYCDEDTVTALMRAGASGYLVKHAAGSELLTGIREICKGRKFLSPQIPRRDGHLTPRETEVLRFIGEGLSNKEMAAKLGISVKTVEKHRDQLMKKLKIRDAASLTRYAYSKGLITDQVSADGPLAPESVALDPQDATPVTN